jgi:hypothetical protein
MIHWDSISALLFCLGLLLILAGNALFFKMIADSNRKLPPEERISYVFGHVGNYLTTWNLYKKLYPASRLSEISLICGVLGLLFSFLAFWRLHWFRL